MKLRTYRAQIAAVALIAPWIANAAQAQDAAPAADAAPAEDTASQGLSEIIVTAQKRTERINDVGMSIQALSGEALLQTWGTAARRHPVGGLGSIGEMLIEHNHGFGQGRGSNSECSFNQAHLPHDTWLQAPCLGLSFA